MGQSQGEVRAAAPHARLNLGERDGVMPDDLHRELERIGRQCFCLQSRMTSRAVTRQYNSILAPLGLEVTEFSLLAAIKLGRHESIAELADRLAFERTTLVRNLRRMAERGLILPASEKGRAVRYVPTRKGDRLLSKALPLWVKAQASVHERLTRDGASGVLDALRDLRSAARQKG